MLDRTSNTILTDWQPHHEQLFGRHNLCLQHRLHQSPLFTDEVLARLLETVERNDYHVTFQDGPLRREGELGDLSGQDILKAVKQGQIWINLRAPAKATPAYGDLLNDIYDEFENNNPFSQDFREQTTIKYAANKDFRPYAFGEILFNNTYNYSNFNEFRLGLGLDADYKKDHQFDIGIMYVQDINQENPGRSIVLSLAYGLSK